MIEFYVSDKHEVKCNACFIGRTGENEAEEIRVIVPDCVCDKWLYLDFEKPDGTKFKTPRIDIVDGIGSYMIGGNLVDTAGMLKIEAVLQDESGICWKSEKKEYYVSKSIDATETVEKSSPDFIEQAQAVLDQVEAGLTPTIGDNGNWYILDKDTGRPSRGLQGEKGEKGDAGSIKFIIVNELPSENIDEAAIYMKSIEEPDTQNTYQEYIYVNGVWELLGTAQVQVDLTDYVKNTDYATQAKAGVIEIGPVTTGLQFDPSGYLKISRASEIDIDKKSNGYNPIVPSNLDYAVGSVFPVVTQAEYDSLVANGTVNENLYYCIKEE